MKDTKFVCALEDREKELKEEGFVSPKKAYFRLGRAIFIIETADRKASMEEMFGTVLGTAMSYGNPAGAKQILTDKKTQDLLKEIFLPVGFLKITVEGDPDGGLGKCASNILLTGYRYGLDDVIVDGKLLQTVHGKKSTVLTQIANKIGGLDFWTQINNDKKTERKIKKTKKILLELAEYFRTYDLSGREPSK